ncbi:ATP adenylyltransferase-domain-containing protein [Gautieria morchelliformis]|nr:ATP adenylyltransferase-domain-containing protein [Gautieria morchelliformis]
MGVFIWHDWAHFVTIGASIYTVWAGFWGLIYRKFFWDFVSGTLRDPGGIQPANSDKIFIDIIVTAPVVQILAMVIGFVILAIELPVPPLKATSIHRSWVVRIVLLVLQAFLTILFYQGTNAALYSVIGIIGYTMAQIRGESAFDEALSSGDLLFFPSSVHPHLDSGVQFELRLCPALQHKPNPSANLVSVGESNERPDPFAPPYNAKLLVGELESDDGDYIVLLNKYSVVPKHFLLVTKEFQSQSSPLFPPDLLQAYLLLLAARRSGQNYFTFFNCGELSGASQPHKHLQFIPVDSDGGGPPVEKLAKLQTVEVQTAPFTIDSLPYTNYVFRLPPSLPSSSSDDIMDALSQAFLQLLDLVIVTMRHDSSHRSGPPSYNVILTLEHLHVIPRSKEKYVFSKTGEFLSINALGYAGMLLAKNSAEIEAMKEEGLGKILSDVGLQKSELPIEEN